MNIETYKIKWGESCDENPISREDLPITINIPNTINPKDISDYLSTEYGYIVNKLELINKNIFI